MSFLLLCRRFGLALFLTLTILPGVLGAANDPVSSRDDDATLIAPDPSFTHSGDLEQYSTPPLIRSHLPPHAAITMLVLGDSIAFGQGASDPRLGFAFELYRQTLIKRPGSTITNRAIPGARLADVTRLELTNPPARADVIILEAGSGDALHDTPPWRLASTMRMLLHTLKAMYPGIPIVVCGIPDLSISSFFVGKTHHQVAALSRADNAAIQYVAKQMGVGFADIFALTQRARKSPSQFLGSDDFYPSDQGHEAIANLVEPILREMLK